LKLDSLVPKILYIVQTGLWQPCALLLRKFDYKHNLIKAISTPVQELYALIPDKLLKRFEDITC